MRQSRRFLCDDRDAVVAGLTAVNGRVTECLELAHWEVFVLELRLLQREDIRLLAFEPGDHVSQPNTQAVHVPRRYFHRKSVASVMPACFNSGSSCGGRPRKSMNASSASRLPPVARIARRNRSAVPR